MLGIAVDIIFALMGIAIVVFYYRRGFVRLALDASKIIVAFFVSGLIAPCVAVNNPMLWLLLYIVIFILVCVALTLLFSLIDGIIKRIPIIRTLNSALGLAFGVGFVYLLFSMAAVIYQTLAIYAPENLFGQTEARLISESRLYNFFNFYGIFLIRN